MFLTNVLRKAKAKHIMVLLQSTGSNHKFISFRERLEDKLQIIHFDPFIEMECVYKEIKKIKSIKKPLNVKRPKNEDTYGIIPEHLKKLEQKS